MQTKALILAAAMDEFAGLGLGGARIDGIAAKAGVNKRLIYEYFRVFPCCGGSIDSSAFLLYLFFWLELGLLYG
ncbi:TetR/AcrR family transcriptional regulator [Candidatus Sodalis pierantonius]|uniref:TetR/AcrR family transcriptional regulator n=1 Tax=Candidatus Sodalis pierantonii TaxID=1486991 RepID=UPI00046D50DD|nr:helix-turn-helix domain-containing protein [Candidatus Sodalis pierantonius]